MKYYLSIIIIIVLGSFIRVQAQPAIGIHPFDKEFSVRTNLNKKQFWDFRTSFDFGYMQGYGYFKYRFEISYNRRPLNAEQIKLYYGVGLAVQDFMPQMVLPFGIEVFPIESVKNFSIASEIIPTINFVYFAGLSLSTDIAFRYYF